MGVTVYCVDSRYGHELCPDRGHDFYRCDCACHLYKHLSDYILAQEQRMQKEDLPEI